jgi:hypothetical protein
VSRVEGENKFTGDRLSKIFKRSQNVEEKMVYSENWVFHHYIETV